MEHEAILVLPFTIGTDTNAHNFIKITHILDSKLKRDKEIDIPGKKARIMCVDKASSPVKVWLEKEDFPTYDKAKERYQELALEGWLDSGDFFNTEFKMPLPCVFE